MTICACVVCKTQLEEVTESKGFYPYNGLEFITYGHYGSTAFDSFNGTKLHLVICDKCVREAIVAGMVKGDLKNVAMGDWNGCNCLSQKI